MSDYLLIESRDLYENLAARDTLTFAGELVRAGDNVTVFFVEQGVAAARKGAVTGLLQEAAKAGVKLLADEFSLRERGIAELAAVSASPLDLVIDRLADGHKVIWN